MFELNSNPKITDAANATSISWQSANTEQTPADQPPIFANLTAMQKMMSIAAGADDAAEARWFKINDLPVLAFHHKQIIEDFIKMKNIEI